MLNKRRVEKLYKQLDEPFKRAKKNIYPKLNIGAFVERAMVIINDSALFGQLTREELETLLDKVDELIKLDIGQEEDVIQLMRMQDILAPLVVQDNNLSTL